MHTFSLNRRWLALLIVLAVLIALSPTLHAGAPATPATELAARLRTLTAYRFTAEIEQTLIPQARPSARGTTSERVDIHLTGVVTSARHSTLSLRLEGAGPTFPPLTIEQNDGIFTLIKDDARLPIQDPAVLSGATLDYLSYLASASALTQLDPAQFPAPAGYTRYAFTVDGKALSAYVRAQWHGQANRVAPPLLDQVSGRGEVWLDPAGLPSRQVLDLTLPNATNAYDAQVHALVDYHFPAGTAAPAPQFALPPLDLAPTAFSSLALALVATLAWLIATGLRRGLQPVIGVSMSLWLVCAPILQTLPPPTTPTLGEALGLSPSAPAATTQSATTPTEAPTHTIASPAVPGTTTTAICGTGTLADTDGDGLPDQDEICLGLDPYLADTDRDLITDSVELTGVSLFSQTWRLDPLQADTNRDGLLDVSEWISPTGTAPSWDPDNDLVPNPWDTDNDGDGVPDGLDLAPYSYTAARDSFAFNTQVEDTFTGYRYIELQIRPQNTAHLRYTTTQLDWPDDEEGQLTDLDSSTDDVYFAPMLAISTDQLPEDALLDLYHVSAFSDASSSTLYVPLSTVSDGGQIVAFSGKVAYGPTVDAAVMWDSMKLVWMAYMAVDTQSGTTVQTAITPIVSYSEAFAFTGWQITKNQDSDYLVLGTPGTPNDDRQLFQVLYGLSYTYLNHQTPDLDTLYTRFSNPNTDPILTWGVPAADTAIRHASPNPGHPDAALVQMNSEIPAFLTNANYPTDGSMASLILAVEQQTGLTDMDDTDASTGTFTVNLSDVGLSTMRTVRLGTYAYSASGWESLTAEDALAAVNARNPDFVAALAELQPTYPDVNQTHLEKGLALAYMQWLTGQSRMIAFDGTNIATDSISDQTVYTRLNLGTTSLAAYLLDVSGILTAGAGVQIDDMAGRWDYLRTDSDALWLPGWLSWAWDVGALLYQTDNKTRIFFISKEILNGAMGIYTLYWVATAQITTITLLGKSLQVIELSTRWAKFTAVVGTVIAIAIYWVMFALTTDFSNRFELGFAISYYVVATVLAIVMLAVSLTPVGAIVVGIFYLLDAILYFAFGISIYEEATQEIARFFYDFDYVTTLTATNFLGLETTLTSGESMQVGSRLLVEDTLKGTLEGTSAATNSDYDNTYVYGELTGSADPGVVVSPQNEDRTCTRANNIITCSNTTGVEYQFTAAGINFALTFDHAVHAHTRVRECTLSSSIWGDGVCWSDHKDTDFPADLPASQQWDPTTVYVDIVPATLDEFWTWSALTNSDSDGDNLTDAEEAALGTNAALWDTDSDGLSDDFEVDNPDFGGDPLLADTDGDGLSDSTEYKWGTALDATDTDGDGLSDTAEVFHFTGSTWTGGGWTVTTDSGATYWIFSDPTDANGDGDDLGDASEYNFATSPFGYNPAPALTLSATPFATSPNGKAAVYVAPGTTVTTVLTLENLSPQAVTDTLQLCLPTGLTYASGGALQGARTPPLQQSGQCLTWDFAANYTLQEWEAVSTTVTANASGPATVGTLAASLAFAGADLVTSVPFVLDPTAPSATLLAPLDGTLLGGGTTAYVVGGVAADADSWVANVTVTLPGQGTVVLTDTAALDAWATTWTLPADGVYTVQATSTDAVGFTSTPSTAQVTIDNTAPTTTLSLADGDAIAGTGTAVITVPLSGTVSDNLSGLTRVQISLDDKPWRTVWRGTGYPLNATWNGVWQIGGGTSAQGKHSVRVRAYDRAGNLSATLARTIVVDLLAPTDELTSRTFLSDPPHYTSGVVITLTGSTNDAGNVPLAPAPVDLAGTLHSLDDATLWLQPGSYADTNGVLRATWIGDFNGDRLSDLALGLPAAADGAGKVALIAGAGGDWPVPDAATAVDDAQSSFIGTAGAGLGAVLAPAGDVNGDGYADLLIGDPAQAQAFLLFGSPAGLALGQARDLTEASKNRWVVLTLSGTGTGTALASAGDINDDGYVDVLVGNDSEVAILLGAPKPAWETVALDSFASLHITTSAPATLAGVGDVNGDTLDDFALGLGTTVYLFSGRSDATATSRTVLSLSDALTTFSTGVSQPQIVALGDVNNDGYPDFGYTNSAGPTLVFGAANNAFTTQTLTGFVPAATGFLAAAGDVDRDDRADLLVGNTAGDAYLLLGSALTTVAATFTAVDDAASTPYTGGGDLNSDGADDLLLIPSTSALTAAPSGYAQTPYIAPGSLPQAPAPAAPAQPDSPRTLRYVDDDGGCAGQTPCYLTLQLAVNAASAGDTLTIYPGVYSSFVVTTNNLTLTSLHTADTVFVDGAGGTYAAKISNASGVTLSGMTFRNAQYGVWLENAGTSGWQTPANRTTISDVLIHSVTSNALYMSRQSTLTLTRATLVGTTNHIGVYGTAASFSPDPAWSTLSTDARAATDSNSRMAYYNNQLTFIGSNNTEDINTFTPGTSTWGTTSNALAALQSNVGDNSAFTWDNTGQLWYLRPDKYDGGFTGSFNLVTDIKYVSDTEIYAVGGFDNVGGSAISWIARWNGSSWQSVGASDPNAPSAYIIKMDRDSSGNIYIVSNGSLRRWNGTSWSILATVGGVSPIIFGFMVDGSDVYLGGSFSTITAVGGNTISVNKLARWNNGTVYHLGSSGCNGINDGVAASRGGYFAADSTYLYLAGLFNSMIGANCTTVTSTNLIRYNKSTGNFSGAGPFNTITPGLNNQPHAIYVTGGKLYVGGDFTTVSDGAAIYNATRVVSYNTSTMAISQRYDFNGQVLDFAEGLNTLWVSGLFSTAGIYGGTLSTSQRLGYITQSTGAWTGLNAISPSGSTVMLASSNVAAASPTMYLGGDFTNAGGNVVVRFAEREPTADSYSGYLFSRYSGGSWTNFTPPTVLNDGVAVTSDGAGTLYALAGSRDPALRTYTIASNTWTTHATLTGAGDGAVLHFVDGTLYALKGNGTNAFCRYDSTGDSWDCSLATLPYTVGAGASLAWDGGYYVYATPGGNGKQFLRYHRLTNTWETLGDGSGVTTTDDDLPTAMNSGGGMVAYNGYLYITPGGSVAAIYRYPLNAYQQRLVLSDVALVAPSTASSATWLTTAPTDTFDVSATNTVRVAGASTTWSPDYSAYGLTTSAATHTQAAFLDSTQSLYRLTSASTITAGYHTYRADAAVATSAAEFSSIQAALDSGANRITIAPGIYRETLAVPSGVTMLGAGADRTLITPPANAAAPALVALEGVTGVTLRRLTLAGDGTADGLHIEDDAQNIAVARLVVRDFATAIALADSTTDAEFTNLTVVGNTDGLAATACAPINIRNTTFAYNTGTGLAYELCASTQLHTYNAFWANGTDLAPVAPGSGERFLDPLFLDYANQDYRTLDASPLIDAGAPGDPTPPGAGTRVDIGHLEQSAASFYADDDYCATCDNDGLTWGVDAFATIQEALDAAEADLIALASDSVQYTVGVGPGTYAESVSVPSHVALAGTDADTTIIAGANASATAVTFSGTVQASVERFTLTGGTGVLVTQAANTIAISHNLIQSQNYGVVLNTKGSATITFNTIVNSTTAGVSATGTGAGTWATVADNILSGNTIGLQATNNGKLTSDYNLLNNPTDYSGVTAGTNDLSGQAPAFVTGTFHLQSTSPAVDTAAPFEPVATGGGTRADRGYWELEARPFTVFLGADDVSTAVAYAGIASVEYGIVSVADPTSPLTSTLPTTWTPVTLSAPQASLSSWQVTHTTGSAGYYRIYARATDVVANTETDESDWYAGAFLVDNTAPTVTWLAPSSGSTTSAPVELKAQVSDYTLGLFNVATIAFVVDGVTYDAEWAVTPWTASGAPRIFRAWVNLASGAHSLYAVATDEAGNSGQSTPIPLTISGTTNDTTAPTLVINTPVANSWVTQTVTFAGTATDASSGVASVAVTLDGVAWSAADLVGSTWTLTLTLPDGEFVSHPAQVRATDKAGNATTQTRVITMDNTPPSALEPITFSSQPGEHFDAGSPLTITWNTPTDNSGTAQVYLTVDTISDTLPLTPVSGNTAAVTLAADQAWYVHLAAADQAGNGRTYDFGPWRIGSTAVFTEPLGQRDQTIIIDGYLDLANDEWTANEHLDDDERGLSAPVAQTQALYATWDGTGLFLGWQRAWWTLDGTLWAYIDSAPGGTLVPVSGTLGTLPFGAEYAISVSGPDAADGLLWTYSGTWTASPLTFAHSDFGGTELVIPMATEQVATLRLLAFALDDSGTPWSVFPTTNALAPDWTDYYEWTDLANVIIINNGQPSVPLVTMALTSPQPSHVTLGPADSMTYTLTLVNAEPLPVTGLALTLATDPTLTFQSVSGATCTNCSNGQNWILAVPALAANATHTVTLTGLLATDLSAVSTVTTTAALTAIAHTLASATLTHALDGRAPSVAIFQRTLAPGAQTLYGTASDGTGGGVALVEVRAVGSGTWQSAQGTTYWAAPVTVPTGTTWQIEARATDVHGLTSVPVTLTLAVDSVAPIITPTLPSLLSGAVAALGGTALDPYPADGQVVTVSVQIDAATNAWQAATVYAAPSGTPQNWLFAWDLPSEDGVTHTLRFAAQDQVGNSTASPWLSTRVDTVAPALTATALLTEITPLTATPILSGTVQDGTGVASLLVTAYYPDGTTNTTVVTPTGTLWTYTQGYPFAGTYSLWVIATDVAGNSTRVGPFSVNVQGLLSTALVVAEAAAPLNVPVTLSAVSQTPVTVTYSTQDGTALAGEDYSATSGVFIIPAGVLSGTFPVTLLDDERLEPDESFTVALSAELNANTSTATTLITIQDNDGNMPQTTADAYTAYINGTLTVAAPGVLANDYDPNGDTLTVSLGQGPTHGALQLNPDGSFSYTPQAGYTGPDTFYYSATDGVNTPAPVLVQITVSPRPPLYLPLVSYNH